MKQLELEYETFATEAQVARLTEAFRLACDACRQTGAGERRTNVNKTTYHGTKGWMSYFMEIAGGRDYKVVEIGFAVDPTYPTVENWDE